MVDLGQGPASPPPPYTWLKTISRCTVKISLTSRGETQQKQSRRQKEHLVTFTYQNSFVKATYSGEKQENGRAKNAAELRTFPSTPLRFLTLNKESLSRLFLGKQYKFRSIMQFFVKTLTGKAITLRLNQATVLKMLRGRFKTKKTSRRGINSDSSSPGNNFKQLQHAKRVNTSPCSSPERWNADFCQDSDGKDDHSRGRTKRPHH